MSGFFRVTQKSELVSVVVPAYNAQATLSRTLASVRAQTYTNLEIVVVDDGSTDGTRPLAEAEARNDPRIRVMSQTNSGVAAARNAGIRASRGALVAPVDADDLWRPEKIARQVAVMAAGGPEMGFVYTHFRIIDADDNVLATPPVPIVYEGHVFLRHLLVNFVGNGSALLMRREAFEAAGGYEPDLQRQGVQGFEDYLLQLLVARSWTVGVVPEFLTGYRWMPGTMSTDRDRMNRSHLLMLEHLRVRFPEIPRDVLSVAVAAANSRRATGLLLHERRPGAAAMQYLPAIRRGPAPAVAVASDLIRPKVSRLFRRLLRLQRRTVPPGGAGSHFLAVDPAIGGPARKNPLHKWLVAFAEREEAFFRHRPANPFRGEVPSPDLQTHPGPSPVQQQLRKRR